jgi:CubicO group peptidase (beta-lactamase class C family)
MPDTFFTVPKEKQSRLARPLPNDPITGKAQTIRLLKEQPKLECGGGCAFATAADYIRFGQMLLNGGVLDGKRVLSPKNGQVDDIGSPGSRHQEQCCRHGSRPSRRA